MKKILSIALALVMMLAVCVPAFAANKTITDQTAGDKTDTATIVTNTATVGDGYFTVSFPASSKIDWEIKENQSTYQMSGCSMEAHLKDGNKLQVVVAPAADTTVSNLTTATGTMAWVGANSVTDTLTYTIDRAANTFLSAGAVQSKTTFTPTLTVTGWQNATVGDYQGTLSFAVTIV